MRTLYLIPLCLLLVGPGLAACGDDDGQANNQNVIDAGVDAAADAAPDAGPQPWTLDVPCTDTIESIYGDPGTLPGQLGAVIRCAPDGHLTRDELQAAIDGWGYAGAPLTTGAAVYRLVYETERGNGDPGYSSGMIFVPDVPRAVSMPVLVGAHGSRGQAAACAPSLKDPLAAAVNDDLELLVYSIVGQGFPMIYPDWAGYANHGADGNPPSGFALSDDIGKSTIDAAAAMRHLLGTHSTDDVVLLAHSQGGHAALSALAMADTYPVDGTLAGVALYAPLWTSQRSWGALFVVEDQYPIDTAVVPVAVSVWYHYTHSEILDGPGHGLDVFATEAATAIQEFVDTACWADEQPLLESVGTVISDLFKPEYASAIAMPAGLSGDCLGNALCETWMARFAADRPHLTGSATQVPILVVYGMADQVIGSGQMACVFERLSQDGATVEACVEPAGDHVNILGTRAEHVAQWIASRTLGEAAPAACDMDKTTFVDGSGTMMISCQTPPPNE